jgi:hypothetical protein
MTRRAGKVAILKKTCRSCICDRDTEEEEEEEEEKRSQRLL